MVSDICKRVYTFRGKRLSDGEWVEGGLFESPEHSYICWAFVNDVPITIEVNSETVSQFVMGTDRNERPIFEGDIVNIYDSRAKENDPPKTIAVVSDRNTLIDKGGGFWKPQDTVCVEVIGNIWDNFDLLDDRTKKWVDNYYRRERGKE